MARSLPGVAAVTTFGGTDFTTSTSNSNVATIIVSLKPWDERKTPDTQLDALLRRANGMFSQVQGAFVFAFGLPPILGLSTAGGFEFMLEDRAGGDVNHLAELAQSPVTPTPH